MGCALKKLDGHLDILGIKVQMGNEVGEFKRYLTSSDSLNKANNFGLYSEDELQSLKDFKQKSGRNNPVFRSFRPWAIWFRKARSLNQSNNHNYFPRPQF